MLADFSTPAQIFDAYDASIVPRQAASINILRIILHLFLPGVLKYIPLITCLACVIMIQHLKRRPHL